MQSRLIIEQKPIVHNKGGELVFDIFLYDDNYRPFDLTGFDEFKVCIKGKSVTAPPATIAGVLDISNVANATGSIVTKQSPDQLGHLVCTIKKADVDLLEEKPKQDIDVQIDNSITPQPKAFRFENILEIKGNSCA